MFIIIKKHFSKNEKIILKTLNKIDEYLNEKEMELFFKDYFPGPKNFINLLLNIKKEISTDTAEIILEKLSLLKASRTVDVLENIIEKTKQKDKSILKFSNLINIKYYKGEKI